MYITYNNSTIATVQEITIHKAVLITHSSNLGSDEYMYKANQPTLHCPYRLSRSKLGQGGA